MSKKILSISHFENNYHLLEIDMRVGGYYPQSYQRAENLEVLAELVAGADEIYVNAEFPGAMYEWEVFPKVARRYQSNLIQQDAREKLGTTAPLEVRAKVLDNMVEARARQMQTAYIAIQEEELEYVRSALGKWMKKVRMLSTLPVALSAMVSKLERPEENFIVVLVGENSSVLAISSSHGVVKMARTVPIGLSQEDEKVAPESRNLFSTEFAREYFMTSTFFKQEFREKVPEVIYFLGCDGLESLFEEYPLAGFSGELRFSLAFKDIHWDSPAQVNRQIHLIANLFVAEEFNFLPERAAVEGLLAILREARILRYATAAMLVLIAGAGAWGYKLHLEQNTKKARINRLVVEIDRLQKEVLAMRSDVERLRIFETWKKLYEESSARRPAWDRLFSELGLLVTEQIMIDKLNFLDRQVGAGPAAPGVAGRKDGLGGGNRAEMSGQIRASTWEEALQVFRSFGESLESSPFFKVTDIVYAPEKIDEPRKVFDFKITVNLLPKENIHES